ncbi:MAG: hypothetical protein GQE15_42480 [Archangiaceae bacterium]|nr:hypothetical protein [Archangiaceae bacterium]
MDLNAPLVVALLVGGFSSIWLVVVIAVQLLRWARQNRAEAAAMMTGTYLQDVTQGVIAPPEFGFSDWLGDLLDSVAEGSAGDAGVSSLGADDTLQSSSDGGSSPEGYSAQ